VVAQGAPSGNWSRMNVGRAGGDSADMRPLSHAARWLPRDKCEWHGVCQPLGLTLRAPLGDPAVALHDARPEASSTLTVIAHVLNRLLGAPGNASDNGRHNATTVAALTRAVLSACEPSVPCNTCGAGFQNLPYPHFAGTCSARPARTRGGCFRVRRRRPPRPRAPAAYHVAKYAAWHCGISG